jgi:hypothetical protein
MRFPLKLVADCMVNPRSYLNGGRIYGRTYLIVIIEGDNIVAVYEGKLRNNFRSQCTPAHPEGKQPFLIAGDYERDYDIKTATFETIRISLDKSYTGKYYVHRHIAKQTALILEKPPKDSEQYGLLEVIRSRTLLEEQLRRSVSINSSDPVKLEIAAQLLQEAVQGAPPRVPLAAIAPADKRFELYVQLATDRVLSDLYSLLEMDVPTEQAKLTAKSA